MAVHKKGSDVYEVDSDTSDRAYVVSWGTEGGDFWVCTCTIWAVRRNRAGGLGNPGFCKHVDQVKQVQEVGDDELAASLQRIERSLRRA